MKHLILAAAAIGSACLAALPAAAQPADDAAYSVRISLADIDLGSPEGQRAFARRAQAGSLHACGMSLGRGATDNASNQICRAQFVSAAWEEARRGTGAQLALRSPN